MQHSRKCDDEDARAPSTTLSVKQLRNCCVSTFAHLPATRNYAATAAQSCRVCRTPLELFPRVLFDMLKSAQSASERPTSNHRMYPTIIVFNLLICDEPRVTRT